MGGIVLEFPGPISEFRTWGKDFDDKTRRLQKITTPPVTWVASHRDIGMEVALFGNVDLDVRTVDTAFPATEQSSKHSLDIGCDRVMVKGAS